MEESTTNHNNNNNNNEEDIITGRIHPHHWWWVASGAQLGFGIRAVRKGLIGDTNFMPLKAFGVASLFVGAAATAFLATLRSSGIHKVEDLKALGSSIRTTIGAPPTKRAD